MSWTPPEFKAVLDIGKELGSICDRIPTRRELFAAMALQAILSDPNSSLGADSMKRHAHAAVVAADALIAELEKDSEDAPV